MSVALIFALVSVIILGGLIYPGELSHVSPRLNRWLYDRSARTYGRKWQTLAYKDPSLQEAVAQFARASIESAGVARVLDLGCGTGRGIRLVSAALPTTTSYTGIDYSPSMLRCFRDWLSECSGSLRQRIDLIEEDLSFWASRDLAGQPFGLVLMLEVGEFVPNFGRVLQRVSKVLPKNGGLILTRPANFWSLFFPGRIQSRRSLSRHLVSLGFDEPKFLKWRFRYELVFCKRI